jgi:hypothetical protein
VNDLPEIDFDGTTYRLGTLVPDVKPDTMARLSAAPGFRVWSRNEIEDAIRAKPMKRRTQFAGRDWVVNQRSRGSCNCAAATGVLRRAMALEGRNDVPQLSWEFLYAQLVDGDDRGSMLDDGMHALLTTGVPPLDPARHPINRDIRKRDYTAEEHAAAKGFTAELCYQVDTEEELATLLLSGQGAGVVAVHVGNSFTSLDRSGFAGADSGPGNHAVGVQDVELIGGELAFDCFNSWDLNFGDAGHCYLSWRRHFRQTNQNHAFYAVVAAKNSATGAPVAVA